MERMSMESPDRIALYVEKLAALFPNCVTEVIDERHSTPMHTAYKKVIHFEKLRQMLSHEVFEGDEAYEFTWVGKKAAMVEANRVTHKTLRPCREESVDWDTTENLYIEGDNLEVLKLLQESYLEKVKIIYIDPPYNTGRDFIYPDSFQMAQKEYQEGTGYFDSEGNINFKRENNASSGRYHSDWCSMMYSRLMLARNLLSDKGVIFISIDDNEVDNLSKICDEIFGSVNRLARMVWQTTPGSNTGTNIITVTEYVLVYAKSKTNCQLQTIPITDDSKYVLEDEYVEKRGRYILNKLDRRMTGVHYSEALNYPIKMPDGEMVYPGSTLERNNDGWNYRWSKAKVEWGIQNGFLVFKKVDGKWNAYFKQYFKVDNNDKPINRSLPYQNLITLNQFNSTQGTKEIMGLFGKKFFDYPKPSGFIQYLLGICQEPEDIIMDFFSGSATTAHAVMQMNAEDGGKRKFIMVQLPESCAKDSETYKAGYQTICEIGKERIRRAAKKIKEEHPNKKFDSGFRVFKLDESNRNNVYYAAGEYHQEMLSLLESNLKADRTDLDFLFGCLLEWGLLLSMPHTLESVQGYTIHIYNNGDLIACFDENIPDIVFQSIAKKKPLRAVFRDSSFYDSPAKINVNELFKLLSPDTRIKVI